MSNVVRFGCPSRGSSAWLGLAVVLMMAGCGDEKTPTRGMATGGAGGSPGGSSAAAGTSAGAGLGGSAAGEGEVTCNKSGLPLICRGGEVCCTVNGGENYCAAECGGRPSLTCDGAEDCGGASCCLDPVVGTRCATTADCTGEDDPVCSTLEDCPGNEYVCCTGSGVGDTAVSVCGRTRSSCI